MNRKYRTYFLSGVMIAAMATASACGAAKQGADAKSNAQSGSASYETAADAAAALQYSFLTAQALKTDSKDEYSDAVLNSGVRITENAGTVSVSGEGAVAEGTKIVISKGGTYMLSGSFSGVQIDAGQSDDVTLVLNNTAITSTDGPAILVNQADRVTISLPDGTDNSVGDSETHSDTEKNGAIFSNADLVLNGSGTLHVTGAFADAIHGKDDVRIVGGNYEITAKDDGIVGKDSLEIQNGNFTLNTTGKAFVSDNDTDADAGYIYVQDGTYRIHAEDDAFHAETDLWIAGGTYEIQTGDDALHAEQTLKIDAGEISVSESKEGIEAGIIAIDGGSISIQAKDDGINAAVSETEEEKQTADTVSSATTKDNAQAAKPQGGPGQNEEGTGYLYINGGSIDVSAEGDGLDANTDIYQTGGEVSIEGPLSDGNGILDYGKEYVATGGRLIGIGSSGMLQTISESSGAHALVVLFDEKQEAGKELVVQAKDGTKLMSITPKKQYSALIYVDETLQDKQAYTVLQGGTKLFDATLSGTNTVVNESGEAAQQKNMQQERREGERKARENETDAS